MKSSNLFWGFFFITFGSLYLVGRYTTFIVDWYAVWELWPVIIIVSGIAIILKGTFVKPVVSVLMGILVAFFVFGIFNDVFDFVDDNNFHKDYSKKYSENNYTLTYNDSIKHVNLKIEAGAGNFEIEKTTSDLIKGYSKGNIGVYEFDTNNKDSIQWVNVAMDDVKGNFLNKSLKNDFDISLNDNPTWSFDINIGAAKSYFNLIPFKVDNLVLNTGATETTIKLGNKSDLTVMNISMGAASLKIYVPESSGCKVKGEMVLMSKVLNGFETKDSDYYVTPGFEQAKQKIIIDIDGGVSSFEVERY